MKVNNNDDVACQVQKCKLKIDATHKIWGGTYIHNHSLKTIVTILMDIQLSNYTHIQKAMIITHTNHLTLFLIRTCKTHAEIKINDMLTWKYRNNFFK